MIEWMDKDDPRKLFLKPLENVYFTEAWPIKAIAGKYFQVIKNLVVPRQVYATVAAGDDYDLDLNDDNGFLPTSQDTLYEMNVTMKGNVLLYPMWPNTDYLLEFQKPGFKPIPTDDEKRYIGCYEESDIPFDGSGGILKIYTVKDMSPPRLRLYNDSIEDEKAVLKFKVNILSLIHI